MANVIFTVSKNVYLTAFYKNLVVLFYVKDYSTQKL